MTRRDYRTYLEPGVAEACAEMAVCVGVRTTSRYIRRAVLLAIRADGYPMGRLSLTNPPQHRQVLHCDKGITCNG